MSEHGSVHVVPLRIYFGVFLALMVLTATTVGVARIDLPQPELFGGHVPSNVILALAIAVLKASLVILFFMHVKYSSRLTQLVVVSGVVWLGILFLITASDYWSRGWLGSPGS